MAEVKFEIIFRAWSPDHERLGKELTLSQAELRVLKELLEMLEL